MNEVLEDALREYNESDQFHNGPYHVAELYGGHAALFVCLCWKQWQAKPLKTDSLYLLIFTNADYYQQ